MTMHAFGLDAGGTKTELLARPVDGGPEQRFFGPAANVNRVGVEGAADVLAGLIRQAMEALPAPVAAAFAGVAGAGRAEEQQALTDALRDRLPTSVAIGITHDADIALEGAFSGQSGTVVITGTGSVVVGRTRTGVIERAGGWGYLLGDEGSGNALGVEALRTLTAAFDGAPATPLAARLRDTLGFSDGADLIRRVYRERWPVQRAAPVVCAAAAAGDAEALALLTRQATLLAQQVARLYERCGDALAPRIAFLGGLAREATYAGHLASAVTALVTGAQVVAPLATPVEGAWQRACRLLPVEVSVAAR